MGFLREQARSVASHHAARIIQDEKLKMYLSDRDPRGKYGQGLYSPSTYATYSVRGIHVSDKVGYP